MIKKLNTLIIENIPSTSEKPARMLKEIEMEDFHISTPATCLDEWDLPGFDLFLMGRSLDKEAAYRCIHKIKIIAPFAPIFILADNETFTRDYESALFDGIYSLAEDTSPDYLLKKLTDLFTNHALRRGDRDYPLIIGQSKSVHDIKKKILNIADKDITVLITGETGTGKELIARAIHFHSSRKSGPLVKINCGALPDELLESEVFGFQKGAFTGAHKNKPGRLEMADHGTLFIDEIGDLSLPLQVKFLQVFEDKTFSRLGGVDDTAVDTRTIAATNSDLARKVKEETFRKDLFYRLNIFHITSPPLRDRKDDIPFLADFFMNKYCFDLKKEPFAIPSDVLDLFMDYEWPGNIREFENVMRRAIAVKDWNYIRGEINLNLDRLKQIKSMNNEPEPEENDEKNDIKLFYENDFDLKKISKVYVSKIEEDAILKALRDTDWNRKKAAELLQVSYKTLLNRIEEFGLKP